MAKNKSGIQKEKKPFDKTYIPLGFAILILVLLVGSLVYVITRRPKDKPVTNPTNTIKIEEVSVDTNNTACSNEEMQNLVDEAKEITVKYEEIDDFPFGTGREYYDYDGNGQLDETVVYGYALRMTLENIYPNLFVQITNNIDDTFQSFNYYVDEDKNYYTWDEGETAKLRTYYVDVYAKTEGCNNVIVRKFDFTVPKWNEVSKLPACENDVYKDKDVCKHFTYENKTFNGMLDELAKEAEKEIRTEREEQKKAENKQNTLKILDKYKYVAIVVFAVVVVVVVMIVVTKGKKKNEEK